MIGESSKGQALLSALEVYNVMKPLFAEKDDVERMYCIFVNAKNRLIAIEKIADGTISRSMIYPREVSYSGHNFFYCDICIDFMTV
jgi:DNA repair protein RadC